MIIQIMHMIVSYLILDVMHELLLELQHRDWYYKTTYPTDTEVGENLN